GEGQIIDLALYEAGFRAAEDALIDYSITGEIRERMGNYNPYIVPSSDFSTKDGRRVSIHAGTDQLFEKLCGIMDRPDLADDERFASRTSRTKNQDALYDILSEWMMTKSADAVVEQLNEAGVPASPVMNIADIAKDQHYRDRGTILDIEDEELGQI